MTGLLQDLRYALRQLRKKPGFAIFAIGIAAIGVGAATAAFSVIHAVILKPLAYSDPDKLVLLDKSVTPVRFDEMRSASKSYSGLGTYAGVLEQMALSGSGTPQVLNASRVSANFLQILGVKPFIGREFSADEEKPGAPGVVIISERLWQQQFGRDPQIQGRIIDLAGEPHTIIGVLPDDVHFPFPGLDLWVTKPAELLEISPESRPISPTLEVFGRLKSNVSIRQANAELAVLKQQYAAAHPGMLDAKPDSMESLSPLKESVVSDIRPKLEILFGVVGLSLLIVCANLSGLMLARAKFRVKEFVIRAAIGAGRRRVIRQLLIENLLLAGLSGAIAVGLAAIGVAAIRNVAYIDLPRASEIRVDPTVLGFALALTTLVGMLLGLAPSLIILRPNLAGMLKANTEPGGEQGYHAGTRLPLGKLLVAGQVALSLLLLIGATLLTRTLVHLYRVDPGFQPDHLLTMKVALSPARYDSSAKQSIFYKDLIDRVEALPGVKSAALCMTLPFTGWAGVPVQLAKGPSLKLNERPISILQLVTPDYFRTMKIPLRRGRESNARDNLSSPPVAIINESLARHFWPEYPKGPDPIGQYLLMGRNPQPKQIVGIAADVLEAGKDEAPRFGLYIPNAQLPTPGAVIVVRTIGDPLSMADAVRKQMLTIDPNQPVSNVRSMDQVTEASEGQLRLIARLLASFAGGTTMLALMGLYAVLSYSVAQRTKEIGIRQALGAQRGQILWLVAAQGLVLCLAGLVVGLGSAFALTRVLRGLLFQVSPTDPATFVEASLLFVFVAVLASYIPARRAAEVDPMVALRYE